MEPLRHLRPLPSTTAGLRSTFDRLPYGCLLFMYRLPTYRKERLSCEGHILTVPPARRARSRRARCLCTLTLLEFLSYFLVLAPRSRLKSSLAHYRTEFIPVPSVYPCVPCVPAGSPWCLFTGTYRFWRLDARLVTRAALAAARTHAPPYTADNRHALPAEDCGAAPAYSTCDALSHDTA